jgi:hypothetical protein
MGGSNYAERQQQGKAEAAEFEQQILSSKECRKTS